ncbi:MAG: ABC transporter ATP-binding protein/permease [Desulfobacterales bacterium]|jgi:ABC-type multidrug transport system fused ATPase/permease subunit
MTKESPPVVRKTLISWITSKNKWLQFLLVITAITTALTNVLPLEMQKRIVNEAINLKKFDLLILYCAIYLVAVIAASMLKYLINILQSIIGQRTLSDMRKALYAHILTIPLSFYRKTQPGMVVAALTTELATAGDFVGMAIAIPLTNVLMLFAFAGYLFWLNPLLAAITLSIYPVVLLLVPVLQKRVNIYNRKRVDAARKVSSKVGESVAGIHEIQANGAFSIENEKFGRLVNHLRKIRIIWNLYRFAVKTINSLFTNFSRFLVFALGGYLAINGRLELGALVAFLSAQEKLYDPWKELIQFYQAYQTASVTYGRTMEYFNVEPEHPLVPVGRHPYELEGNIEINDLSFVVEDGTQLLSGINFDLKHGEHMALVGFSGSGKSTLAQCIVQLYKYSGGKILIDNKEVSQLSKKDIVNSIGFVSQTPFIFEGSIEENLLYASMAMTDGELGNEKRDVPDLDDRILVLQQTGFFVDVLRFGLNAVLDEDEHKDIIRQILNVRKIFRKDFGEDLAEFIEFYDPNNYLHHSSVAENIIFGDPQHDAFKAKNLPQNEIFIEFLVETELREPLLNLGVALIEKLIKLSDQRFSNEEILELSLIDPEEIDDYKRLLYRVKKKGIQRISDKKRNQILQLMLDFIPQKHRFFHLPKKLENQIVEGRALFKEKISAAVPDAISFCRMSKYMHAQSILTNIFFGKLKEEASVAREKINTCIHQLLIQEEFLEDIIEMGMQYPVGTKGENLSGGQRQKLAIARIFLKEPPVLIMDEATSGLDNDSQRRIQELLEARWKGKSTLIAVVHRLDIINNYDRVAVMKAGKIVEMGTYDGLMGKKGVLFELATEKRHKRSSS